MREQGRICASCERWNPHAGIRQDLFGFIDLIVLDPERGAIAIQTCGQSFAEHVRKLTEERNEAVFEWLKHHPLELWGWRKVKQKRGGKAMRWKPRIADVVLNNGNIEAQERK
jgi:hypothetical protein